MTKKKKRPGKVAIAKKMWLNITSDVRMKGEKVLKHVFIVVFLSYILSFE